MGENKKREKNMGKWKLYTPDGTGDKLFGECYTKRRLEEMLRKQFAADGYLEIETPTIEFLDVFMNGRELISQEKMLKLFDRDGRILVLRPDATIPAARLAATKLKDDGFPRKLFYIGNIFRTGSEIEFTQAGVELLGSEAPEADAEVIAQAAEALKNAGLENFQIDIGQVGFFKGIMEETGLSEDEIEQIRTLIDAKDFVGIEVLVKSHEIDDYLKKLIFDMPRLFGPASILDGLDRSKLNKAALDAIDNLRNVIAILNEYGLEKYISVDLGIVQSLNYYTGTIFKGFTYGVGSPVLSGGRYDGLVERFGRKSPATGFSLSVNVLMAALEGQKIEMPGPEIDSLVAYTQSARASAIKVGRVLRKEGLVIDILPGPIDSDGACECADKRGIGGVVYLGEKNQIRIYDRKAGTVVETTTEKMGAGGKEPSK